ncbi:MAG TPA: condensation domain-containing protein, partial [Thermoanaerobaculia bacterium]|nr:condensation domain-containing protein [Thermoanaerobaculia bacterium]
MTRNLTDDLSRLTPAQRVLLEQRLAARGLRIAAVPDRIAPRRDPARYPLSYSQERLWLVDQLGGGASAQYNDVQPVEIRGPLDVRRLRDALTAIVRRHEVMRAGFASDAGSPRQFIRPFAPFFIEQIDLTTLPESQRRGAAAEQVAAEARKPFDL